MLYRNLTSFAFKENALRKFSVKKLLLLICFWCLAFFTHAQRHYPEPINPVKDKQEYQGFTIRLMPAVGGFYGYDIFQGPKIVMHQYLNPMPGKGLSTKDDAFKVATWVIKEYRKTGHWKPVVPPNVAKELKLSNTN